MTLVLTSLLPQYSCPPPFQYTPSLFSPETLQTFLWLKSLKSRTSLHPASTHPSPSLYSHSTLSVLTLHPPSTHPLPSLYLTPTLPVLTLDAPDSPLGSDPRSLAPPLYPGRPRGRTLGCVRHHRNVSRHSAPTNNEQGLTQSTLQTVISLS